MALVLTPIFDENFATAPAADPIDPTTWVADTDVTTYGPLATSGTFCEASPTSYTAALVHEWQEYWVGNTPGNGYVQCIVDNLTDDGESQLLVFYRIQGGTQDNGGYEAVIQNAGVGSILLYNPDYDIVYSAELSNLVANGDEFIFAAVGENHYCFYNGTLVGLGVDDAIVAGGTGTAGLGMYPASVVGDVTFTSVEIGSASGSLGTLPNCTFSSTTGPYAGSKSITINNADASTLDFIIYYTTDGSTPTVDSLSYNNPIVIIGPVTVKALAAAPGYVNSGVVSQSFTTSGGMVQGATYNFSIAEDPVSDDGNFVVVTDETMSGNLYVDPANIGICTQDAAAVADDASSGILYVGPVAYPGDVWPDDQYVDVVIDAIGANINPFLRSAPSGVGTYYVFSIQGGNSIVFAIVANVFKATYNISGLPNPQMGDIWRFAVIGNVFVIAQNWVVVGTKTDTHNYIASGSPGINLEDSGTVGDTSITKWSAGGTGITPPPSVSVPNSFTMMRVGS